MASWCLTRQASENFKKALRDGELNPFKMSEMTSEDRRALIQKYVGEDNSKQVNALYESKLLLKNQKAGYITWAKKVTGMTPEVKRDLISRIERMDRVLNPTEEKAFLQDLASSRLGVEVTVAEAKAVSDLSKRIIETEAAWEAEVKQNPTWATDPRKTRKEWMKNDKRLDYGYAKVAIEKYIGDLKLEAKKISFTSHPLKKTKSAIRETPGALKSLLSTLDNSFFGRQGIKVLYTSPTTWTRAFLKSWTDIGRQLKGIEAIDAVKADIYSRPNAINGKYKAGGYGLDVLSEEAYPSNLPSRIPIFGRLFKASEAAYNGAALRMRADLADKYIAIAENKWNKINTLDPKEAKGIGILVSSLTGRGGLGKAEAISAELNVGFFSVKFLKSNIDQLTAHTILNKDATSFTKRQAAINLTRIVGVVALTLLTAKRIDPDSVDEDPKSKNFGKIKVFGKWVDITGGMGAIVRLSAQVSDFVYQSAVKGEETKYGQRTGVDMAEDFFEGKASPFFGALLDYMRGKTRAGLPVTPLETLKNITLPISSQNLLDLMKDPEAENIVGLMLLDGLGFSVATYPQANQDSKAIPLNKRLSERSLVDTIAVYSQAIGTDPETAFNRIFTGQKVMQVSDGGIIVVERQSVQASEAYKKEHFGKDTREVRLDHTIPNKLGGEEKSSNWKIVPKSLWSSYSPVENALIKAVKNKKISLKEAQRQIVKFKSIEDASDRKDFGDELRSKYK